MKNNLTTKLERTAQGGLRRVLTTEEEKEAGNQRWLGSVTSGNPSSLENRIPISEDEESVPEKQENIYK